MNTSFELESTGARPPRIQNTKFNESSMNMGASKPPGAVQFVSNEMPPALEAQRDHLRQINKEHQARHERRFRIARGLQHLLTALVSLAVAVIQGRTYIIYEQTKNVSGAWPSFPDLLPTLMLFSTAVAATAMDLCALIAYAWPQTRVGSVALKVASSTRYVITTIKSISYTYSTVVSHVGFNQGNISGQNNDLWSWSCSSKADAMSSVNQASSNCITNTIAGYLSIANIGVEVLGIIIDSVAKIDEARWERKMPAADDDSDTKPLMMSSPLPKGRWNEQHQA